MYILIIESEYSTDYFVLKTPLHLLYNI